MFLRVFVFVCVFVCGWLCCCFSEANVSYCLPNEFHVSPLLVHKEASMQCSKIKEKLGCVTRTSYFVCFVFVYFCFVGVLFMLGGGFRCWGGMVWCFGYVFWYVLMFDMLCVLYCVLYV